MTALEILKSHARCVRVDQLQHWVSELQAKIQLTQLEASRLNVFSHELACRDLREEA